jgi:hypothetical protein
VKPQCFSEDRSGVVIVLHDQHAGLMNVRQRNDAGRIGLLGLAHRFGPAFGEEQIGERSADFVRQVLDETAQIDSIDDSR